MATVLQYTGMATQRHHIARELAAAAAFSFTPPGAPQATPCKYSPFPSSRTISLITEDASATGTSHGKAKRGLAKESKLSLQVEAESSTESNWFISWGITELRGAAQHGDEMAARRCSHCCMQPMSHCPQQYLLHPHSHSEHQGLLTHLVPQHRSRTQRRGAPLIHAKQR